MAANDAPTRAWTLRFGPSPAGGGWVVEREDGSGPSFVLEPEAYEEARHVLVRRALADGVDAVQFVIAVDAAGRHVVRQVLDR